MKKYKLNKDYIDRQTALVEKYGGNLKDTLRVAEERLNEQVKGCRAYIAAWSIKGAMVSEIHDILVNWNNHTLANHMEIVLRLWRNALNNADLKERKVLYYHEPTKKERENGIRIKWPLGVPFDKCIKKCGNDSVDIRIKLRIKGEDGRWYKFLF